METVGKQPIFIENYQKTEESGKFRRVNIGIAAAILLPIKRSKKGMRFDGFSR